MSTQSILHNTLENLSIKSDKVLMTMGHQFLLKKRFGIGKGYNREDFKKINFLKRILCQERCELITDLPKLKEKLNFLILNNK